jgi:hypothetical protein
MPPSSTPIDISQEEQWRLIQQSKVLEKFNKVASEPQAELPLGEGTILGLGTPSSDPAHPKERNIQLFASDHPMFFPPPVDGSVRHKIIEYAYRTLK